MSKGKILAVVPERCDDAPEWLNAPIWVYRLNKDGDIVEDVIHSKDQTAEMLILFDIADKVHRQLKAAVKKQDHDL